MTSTSTTTVLYSTIIEEKDNFFDATLYEIIALVGVIIICPIMIYLVCCWQKGKTKKITNRHSEMKAKYHRQGSSPPQQHRQQSQPIRQQSHPIRQQSHPMQQRVQMHHMNQQHTTNDAMLVRPLNTNDDHERNRFGKPANKAQHIQQLSFASDDEGDVEKPPPPAGPPPKQNNNKPRDLLRLKSDSRGVNSGDDDDENDKNHKKNKSKPIESALFILPDVDKDINNMNEAPPSEKPNDRAFSVESNGDIVSEVLKIEKNQKENYIAPDNKHKLEHSLDWADPANYGKVDDEEKKEDDDKEKEKKDDNDDDDGNVSDSSSGEPMAHIIVTNLDEKKKNDNKNLLDAAQKQMAVAPSLQTIFGRNVNDEDDEDSDEDSLLKKQMSYMNNENGGDDGDDANADEIATPLTKPADSNIVLNV